MSTRTAQPVTAPPASAPPGSTGLSPLLDRSVGPGSRQAGRVPFGGMIRLVFGDFGDFVVSCQGDISIGGMFLPTDKPLPLNSTFDFELMVGDDLSLVRGVGLVLRVHEGKKPYEPPAGMAIRFLSLDPAGRELIFRTVDRHIQNGGGPYDLDRIEDRGSGYRCGHWQRGSGRDSRRVSGIWRSMSKLFGSG